MRTYDFKCVTCSSTKLLVDNVVPETPSCCGASMQEYIYLIPKPAVMHVKDRPVVWEHPTTGEIRYPGRNDGDMPSYYKSQGYQRKEFNSYSEHQKFNKEHGLVNHQAEGIRD